MNRRYITAIAAAVLMLCACQRESLAPESGAQYDGKISYAPCVAGIGSANGSGVKSVLSDGSAVTCSGSLTLSSADGRFTIPMTLTVTGAQAADVRSLAPTKGTLINEDGDINDDNFATAIGNTFWVAAWSGDATPEQIIPDAYALDKDEEGKEKSHGFVSLGYVSGTPANGYYQKVLYREGHGASGGHYWMTVQPQTVTVAGAPTDADDEYIWQEDSEDRGKNKGVIKTFYAYANIPADATVAQLNDEGTLKQTLTCTGVPSQDILMGYYNGNGGGTGTASIQFKHPLAAVKFKTGTLASGVTISSVAIENVYGSGELMVKQSAASFTWTRKDGDAFKDENLQVVDAECDGDAVLVIPQSFPSKARIRVTIEQDGEPEPFNIYTPLTGSWSAGTLYTYTIGYNPTSEDPNLLPGKFSVSATKYVQFSRGNLWYNTSEDSWNLEDNQTSFATKVNSDHISHFYNCKGGNYGSALNYDNSWNINEDVDWGVPYNAQHGSSLTTLSTPELHYILLQRVVNGGTGIGKTCQFVTVNGTKGLIIYPDDYSGTLFTLQQTITGIPEDCVFLPVAGKRGTSTIEEISEGKIRYWLSTSYAGDSSNHLLAYPNTTCKANQSSSKSIAFPVRLVQRGNWPEVTTKFVDLGLPSGTLWADVNVGATATTGQRSFGKYYAWGETAAYLEPMTGYGSWTGAKNANYVEGVIKQHASNEYWKWNNTNKYKSKDLMLPEDDIATQKYGDGCHIPTMAQWLELFNASYCTWTWDDVNNGYIVTSVAYPDNSIFISQAGYYQTETFNSQIRFWSSDYWNSNSQNAVYINIPSESGGSKNGFGLSYYGYALPIRAVKQKPVPAGFVDLGLSVYWASENLSGYYQFGGTSQAAGTAWNTVPYYVSGYPDEEDDPIVFSKYNTVGQTLEASDDAAAVAGKGRIPSVAEWDELRNGCTWSWNGTGFTVISNSNGNSITLPANGTNGSYVGERGYYWANEVGGSHNYDAHLLYFGINEQPSAVKNKWGRKNEAYGIRPVHNK